VSDRAIPLWSAREKTRRPRLLVCLTLCSSIAAPFPIYAEMPRPRPALATPTEAATAPAHPHAARLEEDLTQRPKSAAALLARLARMPGFAAHFEETKKISLLTTPLVSRGELFFDPPDRLLRRTQSPSEQRVLVDGDRVVLIDATRREELDLGSDTPIRPLVASLLWVLAGEREPLERSYRVDYTLDPDGRAWALRLVPRTAPLDALIAAIEVRGVSALPTEFRVEEANGDLSITRLSELDTERRFTASEQSSLFDSEAP